MSTIELTETETYGRLRALTIEVLDLREDQLVPQAHFADDLGADSLDLVELVEALEEEFEVAIADDELADVRTVADAYELLVGKLS
jgi:acyl carrier protein